MSRATRVRVLVLGCLAASTLAACASQGGVSGASAYLEAGTPPDPGTPPRLRSPLEGGERVTEYVLRRDASGGLVDRDCVASGAAVHPRGHTGTDFGVPAGTPVHAAAPGTVFESVDGCVIGDKSCGSGFGSHVIIQHPGGRATLYGHLQSGSGLPAVGTVVGCGDLIGLSGNTGHSTGAHLHFDVRDGVASTHGSYFSAAPTDPWPGACSTQTESQWAGGATPDATCDDGTPPAPRDAAQYVRSSIGTTVRARPGQRFTATLTMRNTGNTTWTTADGYDFRYVSSVAITTDTMLALPSDVRPGGTADFTVHVTAPMTNGSVRGEWRLGKGGAPFLAAATLTLSVSMPAAPRSCRSTTLGMNATDGECVQVTYAGCGSSTCSWYQCDDGAWTCVAPTDCRGTTHPNASCGGAPVCQADGLPCHHTSECCNDSGAERCLAGFCTDTSTCGAPAVACSGVSSCCSPLTCSAASFGGARECCLRDGDECEGDGECCGQMHCTAGRCACQMRGQPCASTVDCCGASSCSGGTCV